MEHKLGKKISFNSIFLNDQKEIEELVLFLDNYLESIIRCIIEWIRNSFMSARGK